MKDLFDYQRDAIDKMKNGCILCGGVGSGKSFTSLCYYYKTIGGDIYERGMLPRLTDSHSSFPALYIITTARKRDTKEWEHEVDDAFGKAVLDILPAVTIDSWNNIGKYTDVKDAFFIFDEQRVIGYGAWTKSFLTIAKSNKWILLSATPGDCWMDYLPVFIANGFYKNKTEFVTRHVIFKRFAKFPMIDRYVDEGRLLKLRNYILVGMDFKRNTERIHEDVVYDYDRAGYSRLLKLRYNPWKENRPVETPSELCQVLRRFVGVCEEKEELYDDILELYDRVIVFYNYNYELDILKQHCYKRGHEVREWNGHIHEPIPDCDKWVYLVQYTAGAEGWNCTDTDAMIFWSENYSYKIMEQSAGRIDRLNTPYDVLHYYHFKTRAPIDIGIAHALKSKKTFNEKKFIDPKGQLFNADQIKIDF